MTRHFDLEGAWREDWPMFLSLSEQQRKHQERTLREDDASIWLKQEWKTLEHAPRGRKIAQERFITRLRGLLP